MQWQLLTGPVVGAVIGYITNDIAVRMMFRPHTEKRIFGRRVPFTPGMIPKERPRLARAIRDVLDQELLSPEVLEKALLSEETVARVNELTERTLASILSEQRTPRMLLEGAFGAEAFSTFEESAKRGVGIFLMEKILASGIERTVAQLAVEEARKRVSGHTAGIAGLFWDEKRSASMEQSLSDTIREMLATHAPGTIDGLIEGAVHTGLDTPIAQLAERHADKLEDVRTFLVAQYQGAIRAGLSGALKALDLGAIVEDRINELDTVALEALVMQVMRKELRAIVWLGALLGAFMGIANAIVMML